MTKEERKEYSKAYYQDNKERIKSYAKKYRDKNRDKIKAYKDSRKEITKVYNRMSKQSKKLGYYVVYALPNYNNDDSVYCGFTQNTYSRMIKHRSKGLNTKNWFVLDVCKTELDARILEREYHIKGYEGKWIWGFKKRK